MCAANRAGYMCSPFYNYYKRKGSIVASSFNSKSRYDCFLGYRERLTFAIDKGLDCVASCRTQALCTALSTLTAFYANSEDEKSERYIDVTRFIEANMDLPRSKMRVKDIFLLWGFNNFKLLNVLYSKMSLVGKRIDL